MDTLMIRKLLKKFKCFKGVFPSDQLPYKTELPLNIIVNTDPSTKPGQHWVCICINKKRVGYYFDSFGINPFVEDIIKFLNKRCVKWSYNKQCIQNITSSTCGHYCVLYIIHRCQNISNRKFFSRFKKRTITNDRKMLKIFKNFSLAV
jgi:hypothetical protein